MKQVTKLPTQRRKLIMPSLQQNKTTTSHDGMVAAANDEDANNPHWHNLFTSIEKIYEGTFLHEDNDIKPATRKFQVAGEMAPIM